MTQRRTSMYIHEGQFVAEVEVEIIEDETSWSPYLSVAGANRLDSVREALRTGDVQAAATLGRGLQARTRRSGAMMPNPALERTDA